MSNLLLDRGEAFATEIVESVRDLPRMVPDVANLAGAFLHTCEQETPHVHAYYQRRHMPQVRPCASCVSVEFCWLIWHVAPLALLDVFNIHIMSLKEHVINKRTSKICKNIITILIAPARWQKSTRAP